MIERQDDTREKVESPTRYSKQHCGERVERPKRFGNHRRRRREVVGERQGGHRRRRKLTERQGGTASPHALENSNKYHRMREWAREQERQKKNQV